MKTSDRRDRLRLTSDLILILDVLIAARRTATDSFVASMIGLQARSGLFHAVAHDLMREDAEDGRPVRMAVAVRKKDGLPGPSFFDLAEELYLLTSRAAEDEAAFHGGLLEALGLDRRQGLQALAPGVNEPPDADNAQAPRDDA